MKRRDPKDLPNLVEPTNQVEREQLEVFFHTRSFIPAETILERTIGEREDGESKVHVRARAMARMLDELVSDKFIDRSVDELIAELPEELKDGSHEDNVHLRARMSNRIRKALHFFVVPNQEWPDTPVMQIGRLFDRINVPTDEDERRFLSGMVSSYMRELLDLALEQNWHDPERFMTHDFGHSLRVADYAFKVAEALSEDGTLEKSPLITAMVDRYSITNDEAAFVLYHAHMCHDCGYPHLGKRSKAVHASESAELGVSETLWTSIDAFIQSPDANRAQLKSDLYDSIFYHGADVPKEDFAIRVRTDRGNFLTQPEKLEELLASLTDPDLSPTGEAREILRVDVACGSVPEDMQERIKEIAGEDKTKLLFSEVYFIGRTLDLKEKRDRLAGVEFVQGDAKENPLLATLRLADNLDMTERRLMPVRRNPAYIEILKALGADNPTHHALKYCERIGDDEWDSSTAPAEVLDELAHVDGTIATGLQAKQHILQRVIHEVLDRYPELPSATDLPPDEPAAVITRERIIEVSSLLSSYDLKYQGGSLVIDSVEMVSNEDESYFLVTVNDMFDELDEHTVVEESFNVVTQYKNTSTTSVARYQLWRFDEALATNDFYDHKGKRIRFNVVIQYADGKRVRPRPQDTDVDS